MACSLQRIASVDNHNPHGARTQKHRAPYFSHHEPTHANNFQSCANEPRHWKLFDHLAEITQRHPTTSGKHQRVYPLPHKSRTNMRILFHLLAVSGIASHFQSIERLASAPSSHRSERRFLIYLYLFFVDDPWLRGASLAIAVRHHPRIY